jgi:hypothetical protein
MSRRDWGPPEKERPGAHHNARPFQKSGPHQAHQPAPAYNRPRQCGRYADAWRDGFGYGFRDALRLAGRRLPPEAWPTLDALADEYELAADD